eukprot:657718-Rhodomonas_salina.1
MTGPGVVSIATNVDVGPGVVVGLIGTSMITYAEKPSVKTPSKPLSGRNSGTPRDLVDRVRVEEQRDGNVEGDPGWTEEEGFCNENGARRVGRLRDRVRERFDTSRPRSRRPRSWRDDDTSPVCERDFASLNGVDGLSGRRQLVAKARL